MGADTQSIDGLLKEDYEDFVAEQVNQRCPVKDLFTFRERDFTGREAVYTAHISRNVSPMFVGEDGAFADAGQQGHVQVRVDQRKLMGRIRMTSEAMTDSLSSKGAFKQARKDEMNGLIKDLARREEYALCTDGRGVLAHINEVTPSGDTVLELDNPGGITNANFGNRFCQPGMFVGAINPASGALRATVRKIVSCNSDGTDITLDGAGGATWADNDYLVQVANASVTDALDSSYEHAFWGLMALVDDGTYRNNYFGVDRSVFGSYQSYVKPSTGTLSMDLLQQVADILDQKLGSKIDLMGAHHSTRALVLKMTEGDRRYSNEKLMKPDPGTTAFTQGDLTIGEVPIKALRDFPLDVLQLWDRANSDWRVYESQQGKWVDEDGQILVRAGVGTAARDAFEGWYRIRRQYHCVYPGYNARLDGITGQAFVAVRAE